MRSLRLRYNVNADDCQPFSLLHKDSPCPLSSFQEVELKTGVVIPAPGEAELEDFAESEVSLGHIA